MKIQNNRLIIAPSKTISDAVTTSMFSVSVANLDNFSCVVHSQITATNGVDYNTRVNNISLTASIKGGALVPAGGTIVEFGGVNANSAGGAINDVWSMSLAAGVLTVSCNSNNALNVNNIVTFNIQNFTTKEINLL